MKRIWMGIALPLLCLTVFAGLAAASGIITEMTVPQYKSYYAQAVKWLNMIAREERHFYPAFSGAGILNDRYTIIFRFQPAGTNSVNFHGRHFSVLFDSRSDLIGMLRIKPEWADMNRSDKKRAADRALVFIGTYTPSLWRCVKSQEVEERDLEVKREDGRSAIIKGVLSVFFDHRKNNWFFVLVAPDGSVMAFERNLPDKAVDFGQSSGNWLYDAHLEEALKKARDNARDVDLAGFLETNP